MAKKHTYKTSIIWTGNHGEGTQGYRSYSREFDINCNGKPVIKGSADPSYMGDATRHNPEDLLLASLSSCHMLWYLHLCAVSRVVVTAYEDHAEGLMEVGPDGSGQFVSATLRPRVVISPHSDLLKAESLHQKASALCFVARSVSFPVEHEAEILNG